MMMKVFFVIGLMVNGELQVTYHEMESMSVCEMVVEASAPMMSHARLGCVRKLSMPD